MAFRERAPTFRPRLSVRRVYETLEPRSETKELPEAYLLRVYIPGFPRENVKITYVASSRTVRVTGERQLQGNRWHRIDQSYSIPDYCEPEALQGKFETPILTLTMPKKATSQAPPKQQQQQEVGTSQEKEKAVVAEPKPQEKVQETTPPQPTTTTKVEEPIEEKKSASPPSPDLNAQQKKDTLEDTPSQTLSEPIKDQKGQEEDYVTRIRRGKSQMQPAPPPPPPPPTRASTMKTYEKPQKGQEELESKPTPTMLTKTKTAERPQKGEEEEFEAKQTPAMLTKVKTAERPQKGQEEFEPKSTPTMEPETKTDEQPPKGQEEVEPKPAITNATRKPSVKEQLEEKKTEETSFEDAEKEGISKKEVKEEHFESRKPVKDKEQDDFEETKTEKLLAKEAETSAPKVQKKKEKQSKRRTDAKKEGKSEENVVESVSPVSQVFTKIAEGKLNEEEKKLAANIGAAVLIIAALGYYVSSRFAS